tara:strand:- start:1630 stop:2892 length:1263 start_codon:yes stop_codon:yes gene_type:complete
MEEQEKVQVKVVADDSPAPTKQEQEAAVLDQAVETGEVASEYGLQDDGVYKINLDKPPVQKQEENAIQERETKEVSVGEQAGDSQEVDKEVREQSDNKSSTVQTEEKVLEQTDSPLELIKEDEEVVVKEEKPSITTEQKEEVKEAEKQMLPENVEKLVTFMEETGGSLEDYVNLNRDISKYDNVTLMREYYKSTKPHLNQDDVEFLLNKNFSYDEEADDPSEVKAKQLAFKEELFNAQNHFTTSKEKYYADLKLRKQNEVAPEYKEAYDYYNNQKQLIEESEKLQQDFLSKTDKVFSDDFKGFDFSVGKNKYRFKVDNPLKTKEFQSDIKNFANTFIGKDGTVADAKGYHKALFAGANADKIANHFYEQGRADAIKDQAKAAKNIDMSPRSDNSNVMSSSGQKIRVVSGDDSTKLRVKWK